MAKHILNDITTTDGAPIEAKRDKEIFKIDASIIQVDDTWNARTIFSGLDELMASIKEKGIREPLTVRKTKDKEIILVDGERRLRSVLRLLSEQGIKILVPVIVESSKVSEIDLYLDSIIKNTGEPLLPVEEATSFKRLTAWGMTVKEIANSTGRSESHVRNRLSLADAIPAVKKAVNDGDITAGTAIEIVKTSGGKVDAEEYALLDKQTEPKPPRAKVLRIYVDSGEVKAKGKTDTCEPLQTILSGQHLRASISAAGYDPDSIKLTIVKLRS